MQRGAETPGVCYRAGMADVSSVIRWIGFGLVIAAACDRKEPPPPTVEPPPADAQPIAKAEPIAKVEPFAKAEPIAQAEPTPPAPPPVVAAKILPALPGEWREVRGGKDSIQLQADVGGLVQIGGKFFEQGPLGELREVPALAQGYDVGPKYVPGTGMDDEPEMTVDYERIEGRWPENAWHVVHLSDGRRGDEVVLRHWDGQKWRKPKIDLPRSEDEDEGAGPSVVAKRNRVSSYGPMMVRAWSERGGFILAGMDYESFELTSTRIDAKGPIPSDPAETTENWQLLEWTESARAGLFSYEYRDKVGYRVRRTCPTGDTACKGETLAVPELHEGGLTMVPAPGGLIAVQGKQAVVRFANEKFRRHEAPEGKRIMSISADDRDGAWAVLRDGDDGPRSLWYLDAEGTWSEKATPKTADAEPIEPHEVRMVVGPRVWMVGTNTLHELTPP